MAAREDGDRRLMRILTLDPEPFHELSYMRATGAGGPPEVTALPFLRGTVDQLPAELDAIVAASDLQGRESVGGRLLGEAVADELAVLAELGIIPSLGRTAVLLAGDLYTVPNLDRRGKIGDVRSVWTAFASRFVSVAGVAGNHDDLGIDDPAGRTFGKAPMHLLDGTVADVCGLAVGGVSGIIGDPRKLHRRESGDFLTLVTRLLSRRVDVLVMHEGPDAPGGLAGNPHIRQTLERTMDPPLVVCGHSYWTRALATVVGGGQVLNVDSRVVVITDDAEPGAS
jgi:hypothetical protein